MSPTYHSVEHSRLEALLRRAHAAAGSERDELYEAAIIAGVPLARTLARPYRGRGVDSEDLDQVALEYLVKAVRNYQPTNGSDFRSYAVPTIRGGIRHHFRDHAWAVKLPRRLQEVQVRVNEVEAELAARLHHWPRPCELAEELGIDIVEILQAEQARGCFQPSSLDAPLASDGAGPSLGQLVRDPNNTYELVDQVISLLPVVDGLPPRERLIFQRRFVDHRTQAEIGAEIGVSQMQISRLLSDVMSRLRLALTA
ncbi:sigma-70 family RNA polymerase sigma factor [Kribbella sp. NPDC020789]